MSSSFWRSYIFDKIWDKCFWGEVCGSGEIKHGGRGSILIILILESNIIIMRLSNFCFLFKYAGSSWWGVTCDNHNVFTRENDNWWGVGPLIFKMQSEISYFYIIEYRKGVKQWIEKKNMTCNQYFFFLFHLLFFNYFLEIFRTKKKIDSFFHRWIKWNHKVNFPPHI